MSVKLGRKRSVSEDKNFRVNYGTINDENPISIYVEIKSWVKPLEELENYEGDVRKLNKFIKQHLYNKLPSCFHNRYIVDCDLRHSGLSVKKRSFLNLELVLYPKETNVPFSKNIQLQNIIKSLSTELINELKTRGGYEYNKTKV